MTTISNPRVEVSLPVSFPRCILTVCSLSYVVMFGHAYSKSMDQPDKVANPARGQLNRET